MHLGGPTRAATGGIIGVVGNLPEGESTHGVDSGTIAMARTSYGGTREWRRQMDLRGNGVYISGGALAVIVIILLLIWLL